MIEKLKNEIIDAMRSGSKERLKTLRGLLSEVQKIAINDKRKDIAEADLVGAVSKGIKQRNDSVIQFTDGNRQDLVDIEKVEIEIYKEFQPQQIPEDDIVILIDKVIADMGATSKKQMGRIMGILNKQIIKGAFDMKRLSALVMSKLK